MFVFTQNEFEKNIIIINITSKLCTVVKQIFKCLFSHCMAAIILSSTMWWSRIAPENPTQLSDTRPWKMVPKPQPNKKPGEQNPTFLVPNPDPTFAYPTTSSIDLWRWPSRQKFVDMFSLTDNVLCGPFMKNLKTFFKVRELQTFILVIWAPIFSLHTMQNAKVNVKRLFQLI